MDFDDVEEWIGLHHTVFGSWPSDLDRTIFNWKYVENPYVKSPPIFIAEVNNRIVGARSFFPILMNISGSHVLAFQPCDTMVHPDHRRKGLFTMMTQKALEYYEYKDVKLYFNFPSKYSRQGYYNLGWSEVENHEYIRILDSDFITQKMLTGDLNILRSVFSQIPIKTLNKIIHWVNDNGHYEVEKYDSPPVETLCSLYEKSIPNEIHAVRNDLFYNWRLDDPLHDFQTYIFRDGPEILSAFIVSNRLTNNGTKNTVLLRDVLPMKNEGRREQVDRLVQDVVGSNDIRLWEGPLKRPDIYLNGFLPPEKILPNSERHCHIAVRPTQYNQDLEWQLEGTDIRDSDNWKISIIERDH